MVSPAVPHPLPAQVAPGVGQLAGQTVYVSFSAEITPQTTESLIAALSNCANEGVSEVRLLLSTPGGQVMNGINLDGILADQNRIASIMEERTSLSAKQIKPLFREAKTKDAAYAVSAGIVDKIEDVNIPPGAPVISLVFQR